MAKVIGATSKYYLADKQSTPVRTVKMVAERGWLSKGWTLYTISDRPWMPRARFTKPPYKKKVAGDLSLTEVFARMQAHEEQKTKPKPKPTKGSNTKIDGDIRNENTCDDYNPNVIPHAVAAYKMRMLMGTDPDNVFKQDVPSDNRNYWRNVKRRLAL